MQLADFLNNMTNRPNLTEEEKEHYNKVAMDKIYENKIVEAKTYDQWRKEAIEALENALPMVADSGVCGMYPNTEAAEKIADAIINATLCKLTS